MADTERYQMHCQYCQQRFEGNTVAEALRKVEEHEVTKHSLLVASVAKQAEKEHTSSKTTGLSRATRDANGFRAICQRCYDAAIPA